MTTKAVERQAEAIGADIAQEEQAKAARSVQLELPEILGPAVPVLYIEMDGTQVPGRGDTRQSVRLRHFLRTRSASSAGIHRSFTFS